METARFRAKGSFYKSSAFPFARNSRGAAGLELAQEVPNHARSETHTSDLEVSTAHGRCPPTPQRVGQGTSPLPFLWLHRGGCLESLLPGDSLLRGSVFQFYTCSLKSKLLLLLEPVLGSNKHPQSCRHIGELALLWLSSLWFWFLAIPSLSRKITYTFKILVVSGGTLRACSRSGSALAPAAAFGLPSRLRNPSIFILDLS